MKLTLSRIAELIGTSAGEVDPNATAIGYSIDSRTIRPGELFFAVKGEKMDGHDFVSQALEKGAVAAVVAREQLSGVRLRIGQAGTPVAPASKLIAVEDTLFALQYLAKGVRRLWAKPLIAVTG